MNKIVEKLKKESIERFNPAAKHDYSLDKAPNGDFVSEIYYLTHRARDLLGIPKTMLLKKNEDSDNEKFIACETLLREFIWKCCRRAVMNQGVIEENTEYEPMRQSFVVEGIDDEEMRAMKIIGDVLDDLNSTRSKSAGVRVLNYAMSRYEEDALDIISLGGRS